MRLEIGYTLSTEGSGTIEIEDSEYLDWCRLSKYLDRYSDEELLKREGTIRTYLNMKVGPEKISELVGWGEDIGDVWDVDILD